MSNYSNSKFNYNDLNNSWNKTLVLIKNGSTVLDIGCSVGTFGEALQNDRGCIVDGVEIDLEDSKKAAEKLRKVYRIDIERDPINIQARYDVIFMGDVIEHLARPIPVLKKLSELMNKNGRLVFSIPNITHISVRLMLLKGQIEYGKTGLLDETHLHFYNQEEIFRIFNQAGYKIEKFSYTINDLPYELAKRELEKIGLEPNNKFKQLLKSTNASAYQFIGIAKYGDGVFKQELPKTSPTNIVDQYIQELKDDYTKVIADLKVNLRKLEEDRDRILLDRNQVQSELNNLKQTFKHPLSSTVRITKEYFKK